MLPILASADITSRKFATLRKGRGSLADVRMNQGLEIGRAKSHLGRGGERAIVSMVPFLARTLTKAEEIALKRSFC